MSNLLKKEKGFTLIEIVLVLAIAGLILVIVFLAVSGAQKSRRDTQRKNDNARLLSQIESCASNNNGSYNTGTPACNTAAAYTGTGSYAPNNFNDPLSGTPYQVQTGSANPNCTPPTSAQAAAVIINVTGRVVTTTMCLEQGKQVLTNN